MTAGQATSFRFTFYSFLFILCPMRTRRVFALLLVVTFLVAACDVLGVATEETQTPTPAPTAVVPTLSTAAPPIIQPATTPVSETEEITNLKLWVPPEVLQISEGGAQVLAGQLEAFEASHSGVEVQLEQKQVTGAGGILSYLRTGGNVAPAVLPDLVVVPVDLVATAANENLILPIGEAIDAAAVNALFPPAAAMISPHDRIVAYPFILSGLPHLVYDSEVLTGTLPLTWNRLVSDTGGSLIMAADGNDGALLALQFYLDNGGTVSSEPGQPPLQLEALTLALEPLQQGHDQGFIAPQSSGFSSVEQSWQLFLARGASIARTTADHFLRQPAQNVPAEFAVTPGVDRPLTPLVGGWAWAVSTPDPARKALAEELIAALIDPLNMAAWSQESRVLPSRRDALAEWPQEDPFVSFARLELERAQPLPVAANSKIMTVLTDAVFQVVSGTKTAAQAAQDALLSLQA